MYLFCEPFAEHLYTVYIYRLWMALKRSINVNKRINTLTTRILKQDPGKPEEGDLPGEGRKEVTRAVQD